MSISREEIAALEIVADPKASFRHKLPTGNINIKWILKRHNPSASPSALRDGDSSRRGINSSLAASEKSKGTPPSEEDPDEERHAGGGHGRAGGVVSSLESIVRKGCAEDEDREDASHTAGQHQQQHGESPSSSRGSGSLSRGARFDATFFEPPTPLLTIRDIPAETTITDKTTVLLNSPRSALVVLRQGYSIADLCMVDPNDYYVKGSLEGVSRETVEMRIVAENKRRHIRYKKVLNEYIKLCHAISFVELVRTIRDHKCGEDKQREENKAQLAEIPLFAHGGKMDLTVLDPDHLHVLGLARDRTLRDIRRSLELKEKNLEQYVVKEQLILAKDIPLEKLRQQQEEANQLVRERNLELQKRSVVFRERVERVSREQEAHIQERRERMEARHQEQEDQQERRRVEKNATTEERRSAKTERLKAVKDQMEAGEEERRRTMLEKSELTAKLQARERQRTKEILETQAAECKRISDERLSVIKRLGEIETEERRQRAESVLDKSSMRLKDFAELKQLRLEQKKHLSLDKERRREAARMNAEDSRMRRLRELEDNFDRQQLAIADLALERQQRMDLKSEMARQTRITQLEEKERCMSALEFKYIGYQGNSAAKNRWLDLEAAKKQVLTSHARQEREALFRAKELVLGKIEEQEILRRKRECYKLTKMGPAAAATASPPAGGDRGSPATPRTAPQQSPPSFVAQHRARQDTEASGVEGGRNSGDHTTSNTVGSTSNMQQQQEQQRQEQEQQQEQQQQQQQPEGNTATCLPASPAPDAQLADNEPDSTNGEMQGTMGVDAE